MWVFLIKYWLININIRSLFIYIDYILNMSVSVFISFACTSTHAVQYSCTCVLNIMFCLSKLDLWHKCGEESMIQFPLCMLKNQSRAVSGSVMDSSCSEYVCVSVSKCVYCTSMEHSATWVLKGSSTEVWFLFLDFFRAFSLRLSRLTVSPHYISSIWGRKTKTLLILLNPRFLDSFRRQKAVP